MNNEEMILEILTKMQGEQKSMAEQLAKLEDEQLRIATNTSALKVMLNTLKMDVSEIKTDVKYIWQEIDRFSDRISAQDQIIEKKIM